MRFQVRRLSCLFAMVLATDPVSVVSIFSKFDIPHNLKILAEGESLLNDATALIVFVFVGLYALGGGEITSLLCNRDKCRSSAGFGGGGHGGRFCMVGRHENNREPHRRNDGAYHHWLWGI